MKDKTKFAKFRLRVKDFRNIPIELFKNGRNEMESDKIESEEEVYAK